MTSDEYAKREVPSEKVIICVPRSANEKGFALITTDDLNVLKPQSERFLDARDLSLGGIPSRRTEACCGSEQESEEANLIVKIDNQEAVTENASLNVHRVSNVEENSGGNQRKSSLGCAGSISHDLNSSTGNALDLILMDLVKILNTACIERRNYVESADSSNRVYLCRVASEKCR